MSRSTVKPALTPKRRREVVENDEYGRFIRRVVRAYGRRVAQGDIEALRDLLALAREVDAATDQAVCGLRAFGYSWGEIATRIGVSRQAAQQRWGGEKDA
jgi:prophage DNA circulation protein